MVGRLTYSTGIARPGFEQITPGASISVSNAAVTVGNPALKPTLGQNFDLALEYYPGDGQIAAAGVFYKQFRDYILLSQQIVAGYPYPGLTGTITTVQSFTNGPAHLEGIEGQYQQQLKFLRHPSMAWDLAATSRWWIRRARFTRDLRTLAVNLQGDVECRDLL